MAERWPWGKGAQAVVNRYKTYQRIFLCPPPGVQGRVRKMAAVATAMHALAAQGASLQEALAQAQHQPDPILIVAGRQQEVARFETLRLGRLEPRSGLAWASSDVLYRLWRSGDTLAGFKVRVTSRCDSLPAIYNGEEFDGAS